MRQVQFLSCTPASLKRDLKVCSKCGYHHPLTADERIAYTVDEGSFVEYDTDLRMTDPLHFPEYQAKADKGESVTGRTDTMVRGTASIGGFPVSLLVADFRFMGGSMGSVFGEKFVRAADYAIANRVCVCCLCRVGRGAYAGRLVWLDANGEKPPHPSHNLHKQVHRILWC